FVTIQFFCKRLHSAVRPHNKRSARPLHQGAAVMTVVVTIFVQYLVTHASLPLTKLVLDSRSHRIGVVSSGTQDAQFKVVSELQRRGKKRRFNPAQIVGNETLRLPSKGWCAFRRKSYAFYVDIDVDRDLLSANFRPGVTALSRA